MKYLLLSLLVLTACSTQPPKPPIAVQCFERRGVILMKKDEPKLYPQDKVLALSMKDYDACMVIKLPAVSR